MKQSVAFEFPDARREDYTRARRLEWWTLAYLLSAVVLMALVMGQSQAMRTAWAEDLLSLVPPIIFLVCSRIALRPPSQRFRYGLHRAMSAAHLGASVALLAMGLFLLYEAASKLVRAEHPTIGAMEMFGHTVWLGWLMLPALVYSAVPVVFIGRMKLPLAERLYDKVLYADADMNKADWMTASAAMVGVIGIGLGYWWADAAAAGLISLSVTRDGYRNLRHALFDLMDQSPRTIDNTRPDPIVERVHQKLLAYPWVMDADVRLRVEGHALYGDAFIVPQQDINDLPDRIGRAVEEVRALDWRLHEIAITPVPCITGDAERDRPKG